MRIRLGLYLIITRFKGVNDGALSSPLTNEADAMTPGGEGLKYPSFKFSKSLNWLAEELEVAEQRAQAEGNCLLFGTENSELRLRKRRIDFSEERWYESVLAVWIVPSPSPDGVEAHFSLYIDGWLAGRVSRPGHQLLRNWYTPELRNWECRDVSVAHFRVLHISAAR